MPLQSAASLTGAFGIDAGLRSAASAEMAAPSHASAAIATNRFFIVAPNPGMHRLPSAIRNGTLVEPSSMPPRSQALTPCPCRLGLRHSFARTDVQPILEIVAEGFR